MPPLPAAGCLIALGSLALLPLGFAIAGPLAGAWGARTVLSVGAAVALVMLLAAILPRGTRELLGDRVGDGGGDGVGAGDAARAGAQPSSSTMMSR